MREGPSEPSCRRRLQTALSCSVLRDRVVSVKEKSRQRSWQVWFPEGTVVNQEIIRAGYAWVYPAYCKKPLCLEWKRLESEAATGRLGLWNR
jgi:endonuclease YncB( thermonuclease family)